MCINITHPPQSRIAWGLPESRIYPGKAPTALVVQRCVRGWSAAPSPGFGGDLFFALSHSLSFPRNHRSRVRMTLMRPRPVITFAYANCAVTFACANCVITFLYDNFVIRRGNHVGGRAGQWGWIDGIAVLGWLCPGSLTGPEVHQVQVPPCFSHRSFPTFNAQISDPGVLSWQWCSLGNSSPCFQPSPHGRIPRAGSDTSPVGSWVCAGMSHPRDVPA